MTETHLNAARRIFALSYCDDWESTSPEMRQLCMDQAAAAIDELRHITEDMIEAGARAEINPIPLPGKQAMRVFETMLAVAAGESAVPVLRAI